MTVHNLPITRVDDPIDVLTAEHRVIRSVLDALEVLADVVDRGGPLDEELWQRVLDFLAGYADQEHHKKEEEGLFAALGAYGMPTDTGPVGVMRHEHVEGRALRDRMEDALDRGRRDDLVDATRAFLQLLREHIEKEDAVLFVHAREVLGPDALADLARAFARRDGADACRNYVLLAREICKDAGVAFDRH